jgi:hypothetical protein
LSKAFASPKLAINDKIIALDSMPKMSLPIRGITVCSRPIIAPTKALTKTRIRNCPMFCCNPCLIDNRYYITLTD